MFTLWKVVEGNGRAPMQPLGNFVSVVGALCAGARYGPGVYEARDVGNELAGRLTIYPPKAVERTPNPPVVVRPREVVFAD